MYCQIIFPLIVLGCSDPEIPEGGWLERDGNTAELGCKDSDDTWRVECEGNTWKGNFYNCTQGEFRKLYHLLFSYILHLIGS